MQTKSSKKIALLELLTSMAPDSTKNTLRLWIEQGRVEIDGNTIRRANHVVEPGQIVSVGMRAKFLKCELRIVYEDEDLIVVDKPAGLLSVATEKEMGQTVHAILKRRFHKRRVYPIHRLDRDTSGLMVFAYTEKARDHLKDQLAKRTMHRQYEALVHGHPGSGTWHCFLRENKQMVVFVCPPSEGKEAITHFETIEKRGKYSLLKLTLESGRKHQIRVQASDAGYPIVGDGKYGLAKDKKKPFQLRAVALALCHPTTKKLMHFGKSDA